MKHSAFPAPVAILLCVLVLPGCGPGSEEAAEKGNFDPNHLVQVDIQMAEADWESLRNQYRDFTTELVGDCMSQPFSAGYTYFQSEVGFIRARLVVADAVLAPWSGYGTLFLFLQCRALDFSAQGFLVLL